MLISTQQKGLRNNGRILSIEAQKSNGKLINELNNQNKRVIKKPFLQKNCRNCRRSNEK